MYEPLAACVCFKLRRKAKGPPSRQRMFYLKLPITEPHTLFACDDVSTTYDSLPCDFMIHEACGFRQISGKKYASAILYVRWLETDFSSDVPDGSP